MIAQLTVEECYIALRNVIDPELYQNIVDLGLIYGVDVHPENRIQVTMTLTTPHCPMGPQILESVDHFLRQAGARQVDVQVVWQPMWTPAMMSADLRRQLGILEEEEEAPEDEPEPPWTPPPDRKKKGVFGRFFR